MEVTGDGGESLAQLLPKFRRTQLSRQQQHTTHKILVRGPIAPAIDLVAPRRQLLQ
jgi:hypothetical protein